MTTSQVEQIVAHQRYCKCGTLVASGLEPRFIEDVTCSACGRDNSTPPSLLQRIRFGLNRFKRNTRYFGMDVTLHQALAGFLLPRELKRFHVDETRASRP